MIVPRLHLPRVSRTQLVAMLILGGGLAVGARLAQLMIVDHGALAALAKAQSEDTIEIPGPRGDIVDRQGRLLATSVPVQVLAVEPREIGGAGLAAIERVCNVPGRLTRHATARWFLVRRDCDEQMVAAVNALVKEGLVKKEKIHWGPGYKRQYPHGTTAAHVLGFVTLDETLAEGVEKSYDDLLRSGETRVMRSTDARGESIGVSGSPYPAPPSSLMLTIDLRIQEKLEAALEKAREEHGAKSAHGIVVDPATGDVLAMANVPTYDPNNFSKDDPALHRNRVIELPFEPGSVMKPLTSTALAQNNMVGDHEQVFCENGHWKRGKWTLSDTHGHGWLTLPEVIAVSSNIGMVKFAQRLSPEQLWTALSGLGLGRKSGIDLPAENPGQLAKWQNWRGPDRDTIAFGHSLTLTTLQLAQAYSTVAHGGVRVRPRVARAWGSPDGTWHSTPPSPEERVLDARAAGRVAIWMLGVIEEKSATGHRAAVPGYRVAGKTGTAEKIVNGHYDKGKNIGTFAGFAPIANPAAVVVISLDEPTEGGHTGGAVAAPAFAEVMDETLRLLRVAPDFVPDPPVAPVQKAQARRVSPAAPGSESRQRPVPRPASDVTPIGKPPARLSPAVADTRTVAQGGKRG